MRKYLLVLSLLLLALAGLAGCKTNDPGSQEYVPGKGWRPVN